MKLHELKFERALGALINMEIGLYLNDNQFIEGVLLDIKQDHIVVDANQHVFYFALQHIQAISKNAKDLRISSEVVHYVARDNLIDVLKALRYNWVSINSLSERALFGVLSKIADDHITIINNSELLYIPKSYLSTISSNISKEQIILKNLQDQPAMKGGQLEDIIISEQTQEIKEIERVTTIEMPILEMSPREAMEDENGTYEQLESQQKTRVEMYATLLKSLEHNLLNRDIDNERREELIRETAIRGFVSHNDDKSKGQSESCIIDVQDGQVEEQVIVENTQTIDETELIKSFIVPVIEYSAGEETASENITNENFEVTSQPVSSEDPNLSCLIKHDLQQQVSNYSIGETQPNILASIQISQEDQPLRTRSIIKRKKKRHLLSAWSTMNIDQHTIVNQKNIALKNDTPDCEGDPILTVQPSDPIHSIIIQPLHDHCQNEDFVTLDEKLKSVETTNFPSPVFRMSPKAQKEILEKQYYALMKHAETNCFQIFKRQLNLSEEEQYLALMKHAAKMYHEFKD